MKTPKTYRLSDKSLKQMEWLSARLDLTATDVLERAVADLFERERRRYGRGSYRWMAGCMNSVLTIYPLQWLNKRPLTAWGSMLDS